jgi:cysteine desulfuration protein SufE
VTLEEKRRRLIESLLRTRDERERMARIVHLGRARPGFDASRRIDSHLVPGCLARLWFVARFDGGRAHFEADSDSAIVKGIAGLLCDFYSGHTAAEILAVDPSFLAEAGITQHLTPNRRNGLARLWEFMRAACEAELTPHG